MSESSETSQLEYVRVNRPHVEIDAEVLSADAPVCPNDAAWDDARIYEEDIKYAQKSIPTVPVRVQEYTLKIALVGGRYVGQSSMQKNLVLANVEDLEDLKDASDASWKDFEINPDDYLSRLAPIENKKDHVKIYFSIQNTPGLNSQDENHVQILENYIRGNIEKFYNMDSDVLVTNDILSDGRVDAVLYILPPQMVEQSDVSVMKRLHRAGVAIIPIINKADCLQENQREEIRADLVEKLGEEMFMFSSHALQSVGAVNVPPFCTVSGNEVNTDVHDKWLVRKYRWGECEAFRSRDSDMRFLKQLVFEVGFQELKDNTELEYRAFCRSKVVEMSGCLYDQQPASPATTYPPIPTPPPPPPPSPQSVQHASTSTPVVETTSSSSQADNAVFEQTPVVCEVVQVVDENPIQGITREYVENVVQARNAVSEEAGPNSSNSSCQESTIFNVSDHLEVSVQKVEKISGAPAYRLSLNVDASNKHMALRIGTAEGLLLQKFLDEDASSRPCVYEVWQKCLENMGQRVVRTVIKEFRDTVFYSSIHIIDRDGKIAQIVDARPSDAINLALRSNAKLYVCKSVMREVNRSQTKH